VQKSLMELLAIPLGCQKTTTKWLVMMKRLAIRLGCQKATAKSLVMLKLLGIVAALMLSATASAVGMGGINVVSALGQPLKADIELVAISKTEKDSLVVRLASPEAYKNAGMEYPYGNKFKFQIESRADGQPYIKASSAQPVNDPFVSLLLELTWSSGKLSREYTFLLDPPGYVPEQPAQAAVQPVTPEAQAAAPAVSVAPAGAASSVAAVPEEIAATPQQAAPAVPPAEQTQAEITTKSEQQTGSETTAKPEEQAAPEKIITQSVEQAVPKTAPGTPATHENKEWIAVHRGDTMYKIAEQYKLADMSLERMLVAMYRINADQFDGRNMNRIRAGKILQVPTQQEVTSVSLPEAVKEIHAQAADWNVYRQKLASAATVSNQSQTAQQVATGKVNSSITDMAPVAKESAKEVLKLSKGESPGDQVGTGAGGKSRSGQDKKNAAQEDAIARNKALKEGQERTALLEKNLQDMQRLAQLKAEAAALAQPPAAKPPVAVPAKTAVSEAAPTSAVKPVVPPKPKQVKPEPSLLDQIVNEPLYLASVAAVLLILCGVGFIFYRRRKKNFNEEKIDFIEDPGAATGRMATPIIASPDTGDFTFSAPQAATPQSEHVDPISEADLFLNFGRDAQAEEILKEALHNTPNNHQIHLKLLGIYANRKDINSFAAIAGQLQSSGDQHAWQQAVAMGRKLEPNNPLYGGGGTLEEASSATTQMTAFDVTPKPKNIPKPQASALDFDFDVSALTGKQPASPEQDFLSGADKTSILSADRTFVTPAAEMDFDITSTNPSMHAAGEPAVAASPTSDELVFDLSSTQAFMHPTATPKTSTPEETDDGGMAFTLNFPVENKAAKSAAAQPAEIDLAGISLNFDDAPAPRESAAETKNDHWQEVATKLDLAKAYQEMGDGEGAREILEEVMREGDAEQRAAAQTIFEQLG
jgi:pilus assembly protein FimV